MYKKDLALNNQELLICHKTKMDQTQTNPKGLWLLIVPVVSKSALIIVRSWLI